MNRENQERVVPVSPDKEATALLSALRKKMPKVPLSVSGYIRKDGMRCLHVACDHPNDEDIRLDMRFDASKSTSKLVTHAVKKIKNEFSLT